MGMRNFNLRSSQVINRRNVVLNQFLIYIYHFPPLQLIFFPHLQLSSKKKKPILGRKNIGEGAICPLQVAPMQADIKLALRLSRADEHECLVPFLREWCQS